METVDLTEPKNSEVLSFKEMIDVLCEFFEVVVHSILFVRDLYPKAVFERRRKYNLPVMMSRSPELNEYIVEVVASLRPWLEKSLIERFGVVIADKLGEPLERFMIECAPARATGPRAATLADIEAGLRGCLLRLNAADALFEPNPPGCQFSIVAYTRGQQEAAQSVSWLAAADSEITSSVPSIRPLKSLDVGSLRLQLYVEESSIKQKRPETSPDDDPEAKDADLGPDDNEIVEDDEENEGLLG
eukprot:TRINITY_DN16691_c0_g1_i1.p1 TRINITY_DN16691_c0_g1~~TRINITY_DN16691_c0_g1_i1.p1  ORF type:complete len:245 (+),score=68.78 TRINITY_DN16691_c0_g1_i1:121-855(+)